MRGVVPFLVALVSCGGDDGPRTLDGRWAAELQISDCAESGEIGEYLITVTFDIDDDRIDIRDPGDDPAGSITVERDGDRMVLSGTVPLGVAGNLSGVAVEVVLDGDIASSTSGGTVAAYSFDPTLADCRLAMLLVRQ